MTPIHRSSLAIRKIPLTITLLLTSVMLGTSGVAQTFSVIHYFTGGADGGFPTASLTMDRSGRIYGTTAGGGSYNLSCQPSGCGIVFQLLQAEGGGVVQPLFTFSGMRSQGISPYAPVTVGPDGALYGTTMYGGGGMCNDGCGAVFRLTPPGSVCRSTLCPWTETLIHAFVGGSDGAAPVYGALLFDAAGNIYGTTSAGGAHNRGTVYKLSPSASGLTETILYSFVGAGDGTDPESSLIFDQQGNLYGTTRYGGDLSCGASQGCGTVFELSPTASGWTETTLYTFEVNDVGFNPTGSLVFDSSGNLYGTVPGGGANGSGTVYELHSSGRSWTASVLEAFRGNGGPVAGLTIDALGNLYGTTAASGSRYQGSVFELSQQGGSWQLNTLHSFNIGDGDNVQGGVLLDTNGNLFGTASQGGGGSCYRGCGVIWQITP